MQQANECRMYRNVALRSYLLLRSVILILGFRGWIGLVVWWWFIVEFCHDFGHRCVLLAWDALFRRWPLICRRIVIFHFGVNTRLLFALLRFNSGQNEIPKLVFESFHVNLFAYRELVQVNFLIVPACRLKSLILLHSKHVSQIVLAKSRILVEITKSKNLLICVNILKSVFN